MHTHIPPHTHTILTVRCKLLLFVLLSAVPGDRTVVSKERTAGSYRLSAYFLAKTCSEDPMNLIPPLFFTIILFPVSGLTGWAAFFGTVCLMILMMTMAQVSLCLVRG